MSTSDRNTDIIYRFRETFLDLAAGAGGIVVAFSGGSDSTALLHLCRSLAEELNLRLTAAHLDHGLRGGEADRDRRAAEAEAGRAGVPFVWERVDGRSLAEDHSMSIEEAAREARYAFLERVRDQLGADRIATGHTADDNAETVLINLLRGAGPRGLSGIPPRRGALIRPLLGFWRSELRAWLTEKGVSWVDDSTNRDTAMTRNRVRCELLPYLERSYNPSVKEALARTAAVFRAEEAAWGRFIDLARREAGWTADGREVAMDRIGLGRLDRAVARRLLRAAVEEIAGSTRRYGLDHVDSVLDLAESPGGAIDLPAGLRARVDGGRLLIGRPDNRPSPVYEYRLDVPGEVFIPEIGCRLTADPVVPSPGLNPKSLGSDRAMLDADRVSGPLVVRNPRPGDRFQPLGMEGAKKLSDFYIDARVPAADRPRIPLVLDNRGIVWVGGHRPGHRVRIRDDTRAALVLTCERAE